MSCDVNAQELASTEVSATTTMTMTRSTERTCISGAGPGAPAQRTSTARHAGSGGRRSAWVKERGDILGSRTLVTQQKHFFIVHFYFQRKGHLNIYFRNVKV